MIARKGAREPTPRVSDQPSSNAEVLLCRPTCQGRVGAFRCGRHLRRCLGCSLKSASSDRFLLKRAVQTTHGIIKNEIALQLHGPLSVPMSLLPEARQDRAAMHCNLDGLAAVVEQAASVRRIPWLLGISAHRWLTSMPGKSSTSA